MLYFHVRAVDMEVTKTRTVTSQRGGSGKMESVGPTSWTSGTNSSIQESSDPNNVLLKQSLVQVKMSQSKDLRDSVGSDVIQESSDLVRLANKRVELARTRDPLPGLREVVAGLSNDQAHAHFRRTRPVVYNLRDTTINLNTELRALVRLRDALQKTLGEVSKNLKVNNDTQQLRQRRPAREKVGNVIHVRQFKSAMFHRHSIITRLH